MLAEAGWHHHYSQRRKFIFNSSGSSLWIYCFVRHWALELIPGECSSSISFTHTSRQRHTRPRGPTETHTPARPDRHTHARAPQQTHTPASPDRDTRPRAPTETHKPVRPDRDTPARAPRQRHHVWYVSCYYGNSKASECQTCCSRKFINTFWLKEENRRKVTTRRYGLLRLQFTRNVPVSSVCFSLVLMFTSTTTHTEHSVLFNK